MTSIPHFFRRFASFVLVLALGAPVTRAADLFDNLNRSPEDTSAFGTTSGLAQRFTTDNQAYDLSSVTLKLFAIPNPPNEMSVQLRAGDASKPLNTILGTLTRSSNYALVGEVTFSATGLTLAPNSDYWISIFGGAGSAWQWFRSTNDTGSGVGFQTNWSTSTNSGVTWGSGGSSDPFKMRVTATPVPEPGTWITATVSIAVGAIIARRRRK